MAKAIGMGVFLDDYGADKAVSSLIETSRFRGKGHLSVLYSGVFDQSVYGIAHFSLSSHLSASIIEQWARLYHAPRQ